MRKLYPSKDLQSNPSIPTMTTQTRNVGGHQQRSQSDEKLDEWSQVFSLQHSRWQEEFDDMKARFLTDFEKSKLKETNRQIPKRKPGTFKIPDDCLPMEKRTVRKGQPGHEERLTRDRIRARRITRQSHGSQSSQENERTLNKDASTLTLKMTSQERLDTIQ